MSDNVWILKDGVPVPEPDLKKWGEWMDTDEKHICQDQIGDVFVSTVFLGVNHYNLLAPYENVLFETMVFHGVHDEKIERYATKEEAIKGHQRMVERVKKDLEDEIIKNIVRPPREVKGSKK